MGRTKPGTTRRMFLRCSAGTLVAIPFLDSLAPKTSHAGGSNGLPRRFIGFGTGHGGIRGMNMFPAQETLSASQSYAGHTIRSGALVPMINGSTASLSPVLSASSSVLTPALAAKMNVLRGLDAGFYTAHTRGIYLGNLAGEDETLNVVGNRRPTVDQVLAYSSTFYPTTPLVRSLNLGQTFSISKGRENPFDPNSPLQDTPVATSSLSVFDQIYVPPDPNAMPRKPVVDRVLADYQRVRNGGRISAQDRMRLDAHIARLADLEDKLAAVQSCDTVDTPTMEASDVMFGAPDYGSNPEAQVQYWNLWTDLIVIAMSCDSCRIATMGGDILIDYTGADYHQDVAHRSGWDPSSPPPDDMLPDVHGQELILAGAQGFFERIYLALVAKLDAVDDGFGGTLLDSSLVVWTQEAGIYTHDAIDWGVVMAGGAGGGIRTGNFCDYRNTSVMGNQFGESHPGPFPWYPDATTPEFSWYGLLLPQYYGTLLQAMGLSPEDYEENSYGGYGPMYVSTDFDASYPESVRNAAHDMLPFLAPG